MAKCKYGYVFKYYTLNAVEIGQNTESNVEKRG